MLALWSNGIAVKNMSFVRITYVVATKDNIISATTKYMRKLHNYDATKMLDSFNIHLASNLY